MPATRFCFQGDGKYAGDGGAALQHVWEQHDWRPLKNCAGRFVHHGKELSSMSLALLSEQWKVNRTTPVLRFEMAAGEDSVECLRCSGGGGILTYCKPDGITFVHTLNTESGLCRKLLALGIDADRLQPASDRRCLFSVLCAVLGHIPEPERTAAAPAVAVALRFGLARSALRQEAVPVAQEDLASPISCMPCDRPSVGEHKKKRSVDFLLEGRSVKSNRLLARFAAAPYLPRLLSEPAFSTMLNRTSRQLRKELIEAYVIVEALESMLALGSQRASPSSGDQPSFAVVDLCCGKGFLSLILALEYPSLAVIMVDSNQSNSRSPSTVSLRSPYCVLTPSARNPAPSPCGRHQERSRRSHSQPLLSEGGHHGEVIPRHPCGHPGCRGSHFGPVAPGSTECGGSTLRCGGDAPLWDALAVRDRLVRGDAFAGSPHTCSVLPGQTRRWRPEV